MKDYIFGFVLGMLSMLSGTFLAGVHGVNIGCPANQTCYMYAPTPEKP